MENVLKAKTFLYFRRYFMMIVDNIPHYRVV